jgi:glycosyltransferase involved in cell wall biosynthesis
MLARLPPSLPTPLSLRVALDYRPALLNQSGIGRVARELTRALARLGELDLHLFGHSLARARMAAPPPLGAHLHRLPVPGRALPLLHRLGLGADRLAGRATVFHWTDYVHPPLCRARAVLTVHDLAFARNPAFHGDAQAEELLARTRTAASAAAAIAVPSQATADDVRTFLPEAAIVRVIPFGADHVPQDPHRAPPFGGRPFALALGTVEPRKNHLALLQAWRALPEPRPLLVVAGVRGWECGPAVQELQAAERAGLLRWFEHTGDDEMFAWLAHAALLVYPSSWEGFGFPVLEAMALSVPVVAGDCPALLELTAGAAVLCEGADPRALGDAVQRVLRDEALRKRLRTDGPRRARRFTWETCARAHAALYREVAACRD